MDLKEQIARDLQDHFSDQLHQLMSDTIDTCMAGDLNLRESVQVVFSSLLFELTAAARASSLSKDRFVDLCGFSYDKLVTEVNAVMKARRYQ